MTWINSRLCQLRKCSLTFLDRFFEACFLYWSPKLLISVQREQTACVFNDGPLYQFTYKSLKELMVIYQENDFALDFSNFTFKILMAKQLGTIFRQREITLTLPEPCFLFGVCLAINSCENQLVVGRSWCINLHCLKFWSRQAGQEQCNPAALLARGAVSSWPTGERCSSSD